jgi:chorismate mutase
VSDQSSDPVMEQLREQISETDLAILEAINRRVTLVQRLHTYKAEQGYDLIDTAREDWIVQYLQRCNRGPITPDEVATVSRFLLDLTRRETIRLRGGE